MNRVLIVGVPRSGTTWVGHVLGATRGATYVDEPDNHLTSPFALRAKRRLGMRDFPLLRAGSASPGYESLWDSAFAIESIAARRGAHTRFWRTRRRVSTGVLARVPRRTLLAAVRNTSGGGLRIAAAERLSVPERPPDQATTVVVKSVYAPLAVEWIAERLPVRVAVVLREPLNVLSSWSKLEWLGRPGEDMLDLVAPEVRDELSARWGIAAPPAGASIVARAAWMIGALTSALTDAARRHEDWVVVTHEDLCTNPQEQFRTLAAALGGLPWTEDDARRLKAMDRDGGDFEPFRVAARLNEAWRSRLDPDVVREARAVLERFPLDERVLPRARQ